MNPTSPPLVLCVDHDTYVCAVAAMMQAALELPKFTERFTRAVADLQRAHTAFIHTDSHIGTALIKRQAG